MARDLHNRGGRGYGPSGNDISEELGRLYADYHVHVLLTLENDSRGGDGWGIRVAARRRGTYTLLGSASYGSGHPTGSRTLEGACYRALLEARDALEHSDNDDMGAQRMLGNP